MPAKICDEPPYLLSFYGFDFSFVFDRSKDFIGISKSTAIRSNLGSNANHDYYASFNLNRIYVFS